MARPSHAEEALTYDTLTVITDRLKLLATRRAEMWWDIGCLLDAMATRGFARGVGVRDYSAYAEQVVGIPRSDARRLRRISRLFSRETSMRFGLEKLELLVELIERGRQTTCVVDLMRIEVLSLRQDGSVQSLPFAECSLDDLRFSIREVARLPSSEDPRFSPELGVLRDALDASLTDALGRRAPRVRIENDPGRTAGSLALFDVQPGALDAVGRVLREQAGSLGIPSRKAAKGKAAKGKAAKGKAAKGKAAKGKATTRKR